MVTEISEPDSAVLYRIVHSDVFDDVSSNAVSCEAVKTYVHGAEILDIKFIDDYEMMILISTRGLFESVDIALITNFGPLSASPSQFLIL